MLALHLELSKSCEQQEQYALLHTLRHIHTGNSPLEKGAGWSPLGGRDAAKNRQMAPQKNTAGWCSFSPNFEQNSYKFTHLHTKLGVWVTKWPAQSPASPGRGWL